MQQIIIFCVMSHSKSSCLALLKLFLRILNESIATIVSAESLQLRSYSNTKMFALFQVNKTQLWSPKQGFKNSTRIAIFYHIKKIRGAFWDHQIILLASRQVDVTGFALWNTYSAQWNARNTSSKKNLKTDIRWITLIFQLGWIGLADDYIPHLLTIINWPFFVCVWVLLLLAQVI